MVTRRLFVSSVAATTLTGWSWGNSEADEAKALSAFLQARILDRPGLKLARPQEAETKSFGRFAVDYAIIPQFHDEMNVQFNEPFKKAVASSRGLITLTSLIQQRAELAAVRKSLDPIALALDAAEARANAAQATMKHPEPLKTTFAAAFTKSITQPVAAFRDVIPPARDVFDAGLKLADFAVKNEKHIKINGMLVETAKPELLKQLNALTADLQAQSSRLTEAQRKMQTAVRGA
jgi:Protein of unknown function (DUF3053)